MSMSVLMRLQLERLERLVFGVTNQGSKGKKDLMFLSQSESSRC